MAADMHVEGQGLGAQQMVVNCGDFEAALEQLGHDGIDLGLKQHKITHHHRGTVHRLESDPAYKREGRPDRQTVKRHLKVGAWKAIASPAAAAGDLPNVALILA
jgi:hypothetical protein